jgi:hypothetical protein
MTVLHYQVVPLAIVERIARAAMPLQHLDRDGANPLASQNALGVDDRHLAGNAKHLVELSEQSARTHEFAFDPLKKVAKAPSLLCQLADPTEYDLTLVRRRST